jgi:LPXTG-motif cell wall-anchored protein
MSGIFEQTSNSSGGGVPLYSSSKNSQETETSKGKNSNRKQYLPQTNDVANNWMTALGILLIGLVIVIKWRSPSIGIKK